MIRESAADRKRAVRSHYLRLRRDLDERLLREYSRRILEHITGWEVYLRSERVHCFMSISEKKEIDTDPLLERMHADGKQIVLPRAVGKGELEHVVWSPGEALRISPLGIREPLNGQSVSPEELDLVLVPLVAADRWKNRLGYGMGYYDRFLARTDATTAGLLFERFLSPDPVPVEEHDRPLDYLITEKGIY